MFKLDTIQGFDRVIDVDIYGPTYTADKPTMRFAPEGFDTFAARSEGRKIPIDREWYETQTPHYSLRCPRTGVKPDISVTYSEVSNHCYAVTLKIVNCNLNFDIRSANTVVISLGYNMPASVSVVEEVVDNRKKPLRSLKEVLERKQLTCQVFSSYCESPNPDGVTVLEALVVGDSTINPESSNSSKKKERLLGLLDKHSYSIKLEGNTTTLGDLLDTVTSKLNLTYSFVFKNEEEIKQFKELNYSHAPDSEQTLYTGFSLIDWLNGILKSVAGSAGYKLCYGILFNNEFNLVISKHSLPDYDYLKNLIIPIEYIYNASFSGPLLTLSCPFLPSIAPGSIIEVKPYFFNGGKLPNFLDTATYNPSDNLYQVLKLDVSFATTSGDNKLNIMALPLSSTDLSNLDEALKKVNSSSEETNMALWQSAAKELTQQKTTNIKVKGKLKEDKNSKIEEEEVKTAKGASTSAVPAKLDPVDEEELLYAAFRSRSDPDIQNLLLNGEVYDIADPERHVYQGYAYLANQVFNYGRTSKLPGTDEIWAFSQPMSILWGLIYMTTYSKRCEMQATSKSDDKDPGSFGTSFMAPGNRNWIIFNDIKNCYTKFYLPRAEKVKTFIQTPMGAMFLRVFIQINMQIEDKLGAKENPNLSSSKLANLYSEVLVKNTAQAGAWRYYKK